MSSTKLIYHPIISESSNTSSIFGEELRRMLNEDPTSQIRIVSPFIGYSIISRLTQSRDFKIITDISECLQSDKSRKNQNFLIKNINFIKHVDGVHAKVFCTNTSALVGSANFTKLGLMKRDEMACLLSDPCLIHELQQWFDALWDFGVTPSESQIHTAAATGLEMTTQRRKILDSTTDNLKKPKRSLGNLLARDSARIDLIPNLISL